MLKPYYSFLLLPFAAILFVTNGFAQPNNLRASGNLIVCSITSSRGELQPDDGGYTLDGFRMAAARSKLLDPANFGPGGTVETSITIIDDFEEIGSITAEGLNLCDVFFLGSFANARISNDEIEALYNWSLMPDQLVILTGQPPFSDAAAEFWGYQLGIGNYNPTTPTEVGAVHPFFDGPFGVVSSVNQGGTAQGFFSSTANSSILGQNIVDAPVILLDSTTSDILVADTDYFTDLGSMSEGSGVTNSADIFWANLVSEVAVVIDEMRRDIRVVNTIGSIGGTARVPIELISQGDENALGFSIEFDANILTTPLVSLGEDAAGALLNINDSEVIEGRLGIALALLTGETFSAGVRELIVVDFGVQSDIAVDSTQILFFDQPISREVSDANANALAAGWQQGTVHLFNGYEGDVSPRPDGNGEVTITDWVQCGRFVAGLDTVSVAGNEFQIADTAPRIGSNDELLLGNGQLSITDWVQCGRYAAGLDSPTLAGGPGSPISESIEPPSQDTYKYQATSGKKRIVRLPDSMMHSGDVATLVVELDAEGDENALGFSLDFDPLYLTYDSTALGDAVTAGALLNINSSKADSGKIGFAMALETGTAYNSGTQQILTIYFTAFNPGPTGSTAITFSDDLIVREISDASANVLSAEYVVGSLTITDTEESSMPESDGYYLGSNYPNPFSESTSIEYVLSGAGYVTLKIFNLLGQEIETLVDSHQAPGNYVVDWTGNGYESGVYFYQFRAGSYFATRKLTLLR